MTKKRAQRCGAALPGEPSSSSNNERIASRKKGKSTTPTIQQHWHNVADQVWPLYLAYLDGDDDDDDDNDDEALELLESIIETLSAESVSLLLPPVNLQHQAGLLRVLLAQAHLELAQQQQQDDSSGSPNMMIASHLQSCLTIFPHHAAAWSWAAHHGWHAAATLSKPVTWQWYRHAAQLAQDMRGQTLALLERPDVDHKDWLERLVLHQVCGVELLQNDNDTDTCWSTSAVQGTATYMQAMLASALNWHDDALTCLQQFDVTHRLHPHVWQGRHQDTTAAIPPPTHTPRMYGGGGPRHDGHAGMLPQKLYHRLCQLFAPDTPYWTESSYETRGYYSYYMDVPATSPPQQQQQRPRHLLEDVIAHLLPAATAQQRQHASNDIDDDDNDATTNTIVGVEWWVHTRPHTASLGHNLHFDTDEALLNRDRDVQSLHHPVLSSVLYLTGGSSSSDERDGGNNGGGGGGGGATIVLQQTPRAQQNATLGWKCTPIDNTFLVFPGDYLHGVLPCGSVETSEAARRPDKDHVPNVQDLLASSNVEKQPPAPPHRLTFMVGFWTRRVPDHVATTLYGPCGPLPPRDSTQWVQQLYEGYDDADDSPVAAPMPPDQLLARPVPMVSPVWEKIPKSNDATTLPLDIPRALDHRYFVKDAPRCFDDALLEKDLDEETTKY